MNPQIDPDEICVIRTFECELCLRFDSIMMTKEEVLDKVSSNELDIGTLILISIAGLKGHNCIIIPKTPINVIILADHDDPIELWREEGNKIAEKFIEKYGTAFSSFNVTPFQEFKQIIKELCVGHNYCD